MAWADFRGKLLGPTDPASAPEGSLRKEIYSKWSELGILAGTTGRAVGRDGQGNMTCLVSRFCKSHQRRHRACVAVAYFQLKQALLTL